MGCATILGANDLAVRNLARQLHDCGAERMLLFGSHATGQAAPDSDYDLLIVNKLFENVPRMRRGYGIRDLF